ncbi:MAG: nucleotidyltransferase family protein, partial [Bacteroidia bacterium]
MKINPKIASDIKNFFRNKPVEKAYIFGSFARDEANENSDLD